MPNIPMGSILHQYEKSSGVAVNDSWLLDIMRMDDLLKAMHQYLISAEEVPQNYLMAMLSMQEAFGYIRVLAMKNDALSSLDAELRQLTHDCREVKDDLRTSKRKYLSGEENERIYERIIDAKDKVLTLRQLVGLGSKTREPEKSMAHKAANAITGI